MFKAILDDISKKRNIIPIVKIQWISETVKTKTEIQLSVYVLAQTLLADIAYRATPLMASLTTLSLLQKNLKCG